ncbi:unnamed protein product [Rotaria socialis]|uniref:Uncharacterized protein n=1 Tax=Rotaria socialis TaxID=392032 RepID=A0A821F4M0_9BILA|nr:unnamed protein product [Rotaria socialis]CAF4411344.1 unnamed protein product [Rotaria socialis]CAF4614248.1 unnamed protein product [Rotaria socialis]CAF4647259.1 unnamed protein product [Rotaria socialis]
MQAAILILEATGHHYQYRFQTLEEIVATKTMVTKPSTTEPSTLATSSITLMYESNSTPIFTSNSTTSTTPISSTFMTSTNHTTTKETNRGAYLQVYKRIVYVGVFLIFWNALN